MTKPSNTRSTPEFPPVPEPHEFPTTKMLKFRSHYQRVRDLMQIMEQPLDVKMDLRILKTNPGSVTEGDFNFSKGMLKLLELRQSLIDEEYQEVCDAFYPEDILKELVDLVYVVLGFCATFGWDFDTAFNRVHQSNLSKLDENGKPLKRADGKFLKGPLYQPPVLSDLV